jgi:exo-1,4-beta-D-glucosaminidase
MKRTTIPGLALLALCLWNPATLKAQSSRVRQIELTRFNMQSSVIVTTAGKQLSEPGWQAKDYWFPVTVPCTVLRGLVANKVYSDPYMGMNNMMIPDASDSFNAQYHLSRYSFLPHHANPWKKPYWFRTTFQVPGHDAGSLFQLIFKGINYRAAVWVNGTLIADSSQMAGMFATYALDISHAVRPGQENGLAIEIYPLDYPGLPAHPQLDALGDFYANGGPTGDIGKNVTMLCSVGWDWMPAVRDRNMGIWQPVYLRISGKVTIDRPKVVTTLPRLPDTSLAAISLGLQLANHGSAAEKGSLSVSIMPATFTGAPISFTREVSIPAGGVSALHFDERQVKSLLVHHPRLWWANGYGRPDLYRLHLRFTDGQGRISDDTSFLFGIRTVSSRVTMVNGWARRDFYLNGRRIHLDGGAWVPDMMLDRDSVRYDDEIRLCRNAHINLLRIWGGGVTPPDIFFDLADRYGMLVWQDFWVTGDTQGEFKGSADWPIESRVFIRNMTSTIYRVRNHPSLLLWTGGNEGHARRELYQAMRDSVISIDGTRPFIPSSSGYAKLPAGWKASWPDDEPSGVYSGGPYSWQDPSVYYAKVDAGKDWVFKDETGLPSQPPYSSLAGIVPDLVPDTALPYPLNNTWGYHDACSGNGKYDLYYKAMEERYGKPASMKDFSEKMQLVNANGYRAIFEAAGHKLNETGGVMLWKLNAAFPSVIWQVYDWYLQPNAGYYFMQRACEPVHIQLNLDDSAVAVVDRSFHGAAGTAEVQVLTAEGKTLYHKQVAVSVADTQVKEIVPLAEVLKKEQGLVFVMLTLKDPAGHLLSHNTYWMEPHHDYKSLSAMGPATVRTTVISSGKDKSACKWALSFTNRSERPAFFVHPRLLDSGGKAILPAFWSDNYFSLAPGQTIRVELKCPSRLVSGTLRIAIQGWNVAERGLDID